MKHVKNMDRTLNVVINELISNGHKINVVYDIGANDGRWTTEWMPKIKSSKHIMFEANPKEKCEVVNLGCTYFNQILSDENDKEVIYHLADKGKESTGNSYYKELTNNYTEGNSLKLKTKTLDTMIYEHNIPLPEFIKMDVQGAEVDIIKGGSQAFKYAKAVMLEIPIMRYNEGAPTFDTYINTMCELGFIPTGVHNIAMRHAVVNQMDIIFVKADINNSIHNHKKRYKGF